MKKILLVGFSLFCLACVGAIALILYDVVATASGSDVSGFGVAALFVMLVAMAVRYLWEKRDVTG